MSIKIYNGYRLAPTTDVFAFVAYVREVMDPLRDEAELNHLVAQATHDIDHADFHDEDRPDMPLFLAAVDFDNKQFEMKCTGKTHGFDFDPHRFEMSLGRDAKTHRLGVLLYTETTTMRDAFEALDAVEDYHYQNSTDGPEDVPADDWAERGEFWDRITGDGAPIESMLTMQLRGEYNSTMVAGILDGNALTEKIFIPSKRSRAKTVASIEFANEAVRRGRDVIKAFWLFRDDNGAERIVELVEAAMRDLRAEDFFGKPGQIRPSSLNLDALAVARGAVNQMCDQVILPEDCIKDVAEAESRATKDAELTAMRKKAERNKKRRETASIKRGRR